MPDFEIEKQYPNDIIYGIDEAGLGPLAGPIVVSSCCILNRDISSDLILSINDSKKLTRKKRESIFELLINNNKIIYGISIIEPEIIDEFGLSYAWKKGIIDSIKNQNPTLCLIDGNRKIIFPNNCKSISIVKGDQKSISIAAASIIAKVTRDNIMLKAHKEFPLYGFDKNFGYGTKLHIQQLSLIGCCKLHRKSYAPVSRCFSNTHSINN